MKQLVELQKNVTKLESSDAKVVAVFREESLGKEGLERSQKTTESKFELLNDPDSAKTKAYSQSGFHTYLIDETGVIRNVLTGTKLKRPTAKAVLKGLSSIQPQKAVGK